MSSPIPRRPRFLAALPEEAEVAPLRLARAPGAAALTAAARALAPAAGQDELAAPSAPASHSAEARREALDRVGAAVETLRAQAAHVAEQARADALEIGFAVARAILATEIRQNPEALFSLVRAAVRRAGDSRRILVRVAAEDLPLLRDGRGGAHLDVASARVELTADRSLSGGDCIVEADFGKIDGRLDTRLSELRRAIELAENDAREDVA